MVESEVLLKILAQVDPSFTSTLANVRAQLQGLQTAQASTTGGQLATGLNAATTAIKANVAATQQSTTAAQANAAATLSQIGGYRQLENGLQAATIAFAAFSAGLSYLGSRALSNTMEFDKFKTTLETVTHSTSLAHDELQRLVTFASSAPFEVKSVVEAGVRIRVFQQDVKSLLPLAGDLAAAMDKDITVAADAMARAMEGSALGVRVLTNSLGISRIQLREHGAEVSKHGQVMLQSAEQIEKFRKALIAIVQENFMGGMERQMLTLAGASTNLKDNINIAFRSIGESVEPTLVAITRTMTGAIQVFNQWPVEIKQATAALLLMGVPMGALATGAFGLIGLLARLGVAFEAIATTSKEAAAGEAVLSLASKGLTGSLEVLSSAITGLGTFLLTTPWGLAITGITALTAAVTAATVAQERYNLQLQKQLLLQTEGINNLARAGRSWQELKTIMDAVTGGMATQEENLGHQLGATAEQMGEAAKHLADYTTQAKIFNEFERQGLSSDQASQMARQAQDREKANESELKAIKEITDLRKKMDEAGKQSTPITARDLTPETVKVLEQIPGLIEKGTLNQQNFNIEASKTLGIHKDDLQILGVLTPALLTAYTAHLNAIQSVTTAAKDLNEYLKFPDSKHSMRELQNESKALADQIAIDAKTMKNEFGTDDPEKLRARLLPGAKDYIAGEESRKSIDAYLAEREKFDQVNERILKDGLKIEQDAFEEQKNIHGKTLHEQAAFAHQQLEQVMKNVNSSDDDKHAAKRKAAEADAALHKGEAEELLRQERVKANAAIEAAGQSKAGVIAAKQQELADLQAYEKQHLDQRAALEREMATLRNSIARETIAQRREMENEALQDYIKGQERTMSQLEKNAMIGAEVIVAALESQAKAAREKAAQYAADNPARVRLTDFAEKQESEALVKREEIAKKVLSIEEHLLDVKKKEADNEIKLLEEKAKKGEDVNDRIVAAMRQRLAEEFAAIDQKAFKELLAVGNNANARKAIEEEAAEKKREALDQENDQVQKIINDQKQAAKDVADTIKGIGGPATPLYAPTNNTNAVSTTTGAGNIGLNFRLPGFNQSTPTPDVGPLEKFSNELKNSSKNITDALSANSKGIDTLTSAVNNLASILQGGGKLPTPGALPATVPSGQSTPPFDYAKSGGTFNQTTGQSIPSTTSNVDNSTSIESHVYIGGTGGLTPDPATQDAINGLNKMLAINGWFPAPSGDIKPMFPGVPGMAR